MPSPFVGAPNFWTTVWHRWSLTTASRNSNQPFAGRTAEGGAGAEPVAWNYFVLYGVGDVLAGTRRLCSVALVFLLSTFFLLLYHRSCRC